MRSKLLLSCAVLLLVGLAGRAATACGPYEGGVMITGVIESSDAPTAGYAVTAKCGEQTIMGEVDDDFFMIVGVNTNECMLTVTARECYTHDRVVTKHVKVPAGYLHIRVPGRAATREG